MNPIDVRLKKLSFDSSNSSCDYCVGDVTLVCMELVARDLKDLFTMYYEKLRWLLLEEEGGNNAGLFEGWRIDEVDAVLAHLRSFYDERYRS